RSGALGDEAVVLDLAENQRAIVWVDDRVQAVLKPGLYALWTAFHRVRVETVDARAVRFEHVDLPAIAAATGGAALLETVTVDAGHAGLFLKDGRHEATLGPGTHALWKGQGRSRIVSVDLREQVLDVSGQDVMTADKVTLRLNAVVSFKVSDPARAVTTVEDFRQ